MGREYQDKTFAGSQDEIATLEQDLHKSREECFGVQFQLQQTNKELDDAHSKCDSLNGLLAEKDGIIEKVRQELADMGHERDMIDKDLLHLKDNQENLKQKNAAYEKDLGSVEGKNKELQETVDELKLVNAKKGDEIQKLIAETGNNAATIRQLEKDMAD